MIGVFAVLSIGSFSPLNVLADDLNCKVDICLIDMFNTPISNLNVTAGGKTAATNGSGCAMIEGLGGGSYELTIPSSYKPLT